MSLEVNSEVHIKPGTFHNPGDEPLKARVLRVMGGGAIAILEVSPKPYASFWPRVRVQDLDF